MTYEEMKQEINISRNWNDDYTKKVIKLALELGHPICGVKTRSGNPCKKYQTGKNGRCSTPQHNVGAPKGNKNAIGNVGGGPPKKNKNAVSTGEHETIWMDTLTGEEKKLLPKVKHEVIDLIDDDIKLVEIRIRRMMQRIAGLADVDYSIVERSHKEGVTAKGEVDYTVTKTEATVDKIQNIEEALTRVQGKKTQLLKLKYQVENDEAPESVNVNNYINAIRGRSEEVWNQEG